MACYFDLPCLWQNTSFLDSCLKKKKTSVGYNIVKKRFMSAENPVPSLFSLNLLLIKMSFVVPQLLYLYSRGH